MNKKDKKNIKRLGKTIDDYLKSKMSMSDFIEKHIFEEYEETGNEDLKEIATDYFIKKLE